MIFLVRCGCEEHREVILAGFAVEMVDGLRGRASKTLRYQAEPGNEREELESHQSDLR